MAITNITGQKPKPIVEENTLDAALSKKIASANVLRKALVEAIKDILLQYKSNFNLESDERNVKIVDCIMKRHKALLDNMLSKDINVENIMSALDLNIEDWLSRYYLLSKPSSGPDDVRTIKEDVIECILDALKKYSGKDIEALTTVVETTVIDKNENIDNFDALNNYFMNILSFMKLLYKQKLSVVKAIDKSEKTELTNLITKLSVVTKRGKTGIAFSSIKSKLNVFKTKLSAKFNKPITLADRLPKKSLNPFRSIDFNKRIGLNKSLKVGLKKILDISGIAVIKDVVGKIATSLLNKMKPLINKVKTIINKIKSVIIGFVLSLIPFVGPILKIVKFVLKPILFTLKIAFKILSFAVKFIGKSIGLIFTGVFKLMKFTITGITKTIGFLTKGIYKILNSNIVKKLVSFMLTPTGAFITGYLVGLFYVKIWKPLKEKIDLAGGFIAVFKSIYDTIKDKVIGWKNTLTDKYNELKDKLSKPGGKMEKAMNFLKNLNKNTLLAAWEKFKLNINKKLIRPIMNIFNGIKEMFVESAVRAGSGLLVRLIMKGLSAIPPWGTILAGVVGIGQGLWELFFENSDTKRNEKDELMLRKQEYLKMYGVNSLDNQANHATLIDLQTLANDKNSKLDAETKKKINDKIKAEKMTGVITILQQRFLDDIKSAIDKELVICDKYKNLTRQEIDDAKGDTLDAVGKTEIPIPSKIDANGNIVESSTTLDLPNGVNPIMFKMIRANMLYSMLQKYYNGLITYDDFIDYYQNMTKIDSNGKLLIDSKLLEDEKKKSGANIDKALSFDINGKTNYSDINDYTKYTNSNLFLDAAANEAKQKKAAIDQIFQKFLNAHLFDFIPFNKRAIFLSKFNSALMKLDLKEFTTKSQDEQIKWLMDLYNDLSIDIDKIVKENEEKALTSIEKDSATLPDTNIPTSSDEVTTNAQTVKLIELAKTAADHVNQSDLAANAEMNKQMESTTNDINHNVEKETTQAKNDTNEVKVSLSQKLDDIIDKATTLLTPNKSVAVIGNEKQINPAAEEAQRIMNEQIA